MDFVGREREIAEIASALQADVNVVLSGKFGMGRTSLVRQVAANCRHRMQFVLSDFSRPPASVCRQLGSQLARPLWSARRVEELAYRKARRQLLDAARRAKPPAVFVLDNVARMTPAKWDLVRFLSGASRPRIVVVVESFLPEADVERLRAFVYPSICLRLGRLPARRSHEFFERVSGRIGLGWSRDQIRGLAVRGGGYPLAMVEAAAEAAAHRRSR
jgi:hypothetical protein